MHRVQGYGTIVDPDASTVEFDTYTCAHCNKIVQLRPHAPPDGHCLMCNEGICETCAVRGNCDPFEKKLERMEARDRLRRSILG